MAEVDTSSYPKPGPQPSLLDQVQKYQQLESNSLGIDKQKLDLMNTQFGLMNSELSNLAGVDQNGQPRFTKEQAAQRLGTFAKTYNMPAPVVQHMMQELQQSRDVPSFAEHALRRGMDVQQKINQTYGTPSSIDNGRVIQPGMIRPQVQGGGFTPSGLPVQKQLDVAQPVFNRGTGGSVPAGTQPSISNPGTVNFEGGAAQPPLPAAKPATVSGPTGPTQRRTDLELSPPASFEADRAALAKDREIASAAATSLQPLERAYDIAREIDKTGIGTENLNKIRAMLSNAGIKDVNNKSPEVLYQMMNKNLAQAVIQNNPRSDSAQILAEAGSPNAKTQILPALLNNTREIIGRQRMIVARPNAFENGENPIGYSKHSSQFPTSQDEKAYSIDKMQPEDARQLYIDMKNKAINGKGAEKEEGIKFLKSLSTAKKQGLINGIN